jgi:hypothetical protein
MAGRVSLNAVLEHINDDSDWHDSEDDLVGDEQEGEIDRLYPRASNPIDRLQVEDMEDSVNEDSPMSSHQLQYCCHTECLVTLPLIQVQVRIPQQIPC